MAQFCGRLKRDCRRFVSVAFPEGSVNDRRSRPSVFVAHRGTNREPKQVVYTARASRYHFSSSF
ncbi:hypothetical protein FRUB_01706 [Fimbriiglobus ruber]|uniref:Uncharacterized protein n=1 Tax=Fimbriiglobus ruber TaxID=1908690 RepID=A0A225E9X7_9BACT|nr:hypothetical protein FRUB_01706 [Fimbriiglobus ruber]